MHIRESLFVIDTTIDFDASGNCGTVKYILLTSLRNLRILSSVEGPWEAGA